MRRVVAVLAGLTVITTAGVARAACPPFPSDVPGWERLSHASVVRYVETRVDGDWQRYEDALIASLNALTEIRQSGGAALVDDGRRLAGDALERYIERLTQRIGVTRCLARTQSARTAALAGDGDDTQRMAAFETAAGGDQTSSSSRPAPVGADAAGETAAPDPGDDIRIEVKSRCSGDQGMVRIVNAGPAWPGRAHLTIRDAEDFNAPPIALRVLRMVEGQTATFYVEPERLLEVSITPIWGAEEIVRNARPSCAGN